MAPDWIRVEVALAIVLMWTAALRLARVALERRGEGSESRSFTELLRDELSASQRKDGKAPPDHGESVRPSRGRSTGDRPTAVELPDLDYFLTEAPSRGCPASEAETEADPEDDPEDDAGCSGGDEAD